MTTVFVFIRFVSECALWLGCGGVVLSLFTTLTDLTPAMLFLGLSAAACHYLGEKKQALRFAGLLLLAGVLPFCHSVGDGLLLLPAAVYVADSARRDKLRPDSNGIYYQFGTIAGICLVGSLFCVFGGLEWCFFCCIASLVSDLFLCRMLRHRAADWWDRHLLLMELGLLGLTLLAALFFSRQFMLNAALQLIKKLYFLIVYPVLLVLVYLVIVVFQILNWILAFLMPDRFEPPDMQNLQMMEGVSEFMEQAEPAAANPVLVVLVRLAGAGLFLLAGFFVMRFLRKGAGSIAARKDSGDTRLEMQDAQNVFAPPTLLDRSPEAAVRRAYLSYCRWLRDTGVKITRSDTSRSVNQQACRDADPAAVELRRLYLAARYTGHSGLTREDARRAAQLVREIKKDKTR